MLFDLIPITVTGKVEPKVRQHLAEIERELEKHFADIDVRSLVEDTWRSLYRPLTVADSPRVTLFFSPRAATLTKIGVEDNVVSVEVTLAGTTTAHVGEDLPEPAVAPLPELSLSEFDGDGRFHVRLPVYLNHTDIGGHDTVRFLSGLRWRVDVEERLLVAELAIGDDRFAASLTYDYSDHVEAVARDWVVALGDERVVVVNVHDVVVEDGLSLDDEGLKLELAIEGSVHVDLAGLGR